MALDLSDVLHAGRTANLSHTRAEGQCLISIGAAGLWYFNWIAETCGVPKRHIGVEFYTPAPAVLPPGVEWVANTAGSMPDVENGVGDLLFSGQNLEHLWEEEVSGFLAEAHRVLRPGGRIIIDSPNRAITEIYGGAHPEHMVELTAGEAVELFEAAGFDVERVKGILLCRDPRTGAILPIENLAGEPPLSLLYRAIAAGDEADHSYCWWIEAIRSDRAPDMVAVQKMVARYWATGWPERMNRLVSGIGSPGILPDGGQSWDAEAGQTGPLSFGPYAPMKAGRYRSTLNVMRTTEVAEDEVFGHIDVVFGDGSVAETRRDLTAAVLPIDQWVPLTLEFNLDEMRFGFQNRVFSYGPAGLRVERRMILESV